MPIQPKHLHPYPRLSPTHLRPEFTGKTILITGAGSGIGASTATAFALAGASHLILAGRTLSKLSTTAASLATSFPALKTTTFAVDISSKTDVAALFAALDTSPDVLVNNAGYMPTVSKFGDADADADAELDLGEWWRAFEVNVFGTALVTQSFLKHRSGLSGKGNASASATPAVVITINTMGAYSQPFRVPGLSAYSASKAALLRLSETLADDVPVGVARFVSLHPGGVATDMAAKAGIEESEHFPFTDARLSAEFVVWAASEEAGFLAGRFAWVNWDVDELVAAREEIVGRDLFRTAVSDLA
ncbi:Short chain dehydrogenase [Lachnellula willkommii]|uniref:Short chain dehydrogenase n=1 Tax=Lachnellula willkommii TaxID=215461 RepID=A0A559M638_9HELO|nr:Short chain dehydrogenase [Lachnellula willkommii]